MAKPDWKQFIAAGFENMAFLSKDGKTAVAASSVTVHINSREIGIPPGEPIDTSAILTGSMSWSMELTGEQSEAFQRFFLPKTFILQLNKADGTPIARIEFASHEDVTRWYQGEIVPVAWYRLEEDIWQFVEVTPFKLGGVKIEDS